MYRFHITYLVEEMEDAWMSSFFHDVKALTYEEAFDKLITELDLLLVCESYTVTDYEYIDDE